MHAYPRTLTKRTTLLQVTPHRRAHLRKLHTHDATRAPPWPLPTATNDHIHSPSPSARCRRRHVAPAPAATSSSRALPPYSTPLQLMQPRSRTHELLASCASCRVLRAAAVQLRSQPPHPSSARHPTTLPGAHVPRTLCGPRGHDPALTDAENARGAAPGVPRGELPTASCRRSRSSTGGRRRRRTSRSRRR